MANSLLEAIRKKIESPAPTPPQQLGGTEQASSLLRTKLTGRAEAGPGAEARRSTIGEQAVAQQTGAALGQERAQAAIQSEQLAQQGGAQEQSARIQQQQLAQNLQLKSEQAAQQGAQLWQQFEQAGRQLNTEQDLQKLEQVAFNARLSNQKYINNLQGEARREGLDNDLKFKEDYYTQVFEDSGELFGSDIAFKKLMDSDEREFISEMSKMDTGFALDLAKQASREANQRAMAESIGGLIGGAVQGYDAYDKYQTRKRLEGGA